MPASPIAIPYEQQSLAETHRGCGAACLSMVYKSFGKEIAPGEIWPALAKANRFGEVSSTTHLMALHAMSQGFSAVTIQARHPLQVLRLCRDAGIRAILHQRPVPDVSAGHYTVLVDIDEKNVVVHDPALGPNRRMPHAELIELWQPGSAESEILGNVAIGICAEPSPAHVCEFCRTPMPPRIDCPRCGKTLGLSPTAMLGCIVDGCIARMWNYVACPSCDFMWSFQEAAASVAEVPSGAPADRPNRLVVPDLDVAFGQLDKLIAQMLSIPGAANHPDLKAQIDFIQSTKETVRLAQAEEIGRLNLRMDRAAAALEAKTKFRADRKRAQESNSAPAPIDGIALGHALLKNLGFE
jgi:predicted double-glycine peptidase